MLSLVNHHLLKASFNIRIYNHRESFLNRLSLWNVQFGKTHIAVNVYDKNIERDIGRIQEMITDILNKCIRCRKLI